MSSLVLDPRSIVEALSSLQIGCKLEDITHPTAERVQLIYLAFCTQILDVPEKSLAELPFECQINPDTAEMHQKSTPLLLLFTTMRCFILDFGDAAADFTICDLINPLPKRTRKLLSVVADYTVFFRTASQVFERTSGEYDDARRAIEDGQEQVRLAEERKNALRSEQDARRRRENALLAESSSKNAILTELLKEAKANEDRRDAILNAIRSGKQETTNLHVEIKSLKGEIEHLSKGVVRSPARVRRDVDSHRALTKRLQDDCDAERQRIVDNAESMIVIEQTAKLLDERFREMDKLRDLQIQINLLEQDAAQARALIAEATKHRQQTIDSLNRLVNSGEEEARSHEHARKVYSSRLQDLKAKKESLINFITNLREDAPLVRDELSQLQREMVRLRNARSEEAQQALMQCLELLRRFNSLTEKYSRTEELFDAQSAAFADMARSVTAALDEMDEAAADLGTSMKIPG